MQVLPVETVLAEGLSLLNADTNLLEDGQFDD